MNIGFFLLFFTILFFPLTAANIKPFLKPCPDKSDNNKMAEIDFIYMINLDERPEKFAESKKQLEPYHITPYRFSAVNGWKLPLEDIGKLALYIEPWMDNSMMGTRYPLENKGEPLHERIQPGKSYFSHCMSRGAIGIVLSQLSVLEDAYKSGYGTIWVMEDDIEVIKNPNKLSDYIRQLDALVGKENWDILFTDPDTKNREGSYVPCLSYAKRPNFSPSNPEKFAIRKNISPTFDKIHARYGTYSAIIRRSGIKKIRRFFRQNGVFLPYDMEFYLSNKINLYTLNFDVISTLPKALSDNGGPNYERKNLPN